jgi:MoxR-like ATPase
MNSTPLLDEQHLAALALGQRLTTAVLEPMKQAFVGKSEIIDLLGVSLVARENLFILGPPGTAKSALVQDLSRRIAGQVFDYLLTRFTEPNEIFGPFDIRQLREGNLVTNTEGMLPEATFVFLDELLNANSAILNSLLMVLNERVFRRGRETRSLPTLLIVGASNSLPEDDALKALFDRFLLRVNCTNVADESLEELLRIGWNLEYRQPAVPALSVDEVQALQRLVQQVSLAEVAPLYGKTIKRLRTAGIAISDRRAVKLQRLVAASAVLCERLVADASDLWILRYIWETIEQQEILNALISAAIREADTTATPTTVARHPQSATLGLPDPEAIDRDLESLRQTLENQLDDVRRLQLRDHLSVLAAQLAWIPAEQTRQHLQAKLDLLWQKVDE